MMVGGIENSHNSGIRQIVQKNFFMEKHVDKRMDASKLKIYFQKSNHMYYSILYVI